MNNRKPLTNFFNLENIPAPREVTASKKSD